MTANALQTAGAINVNRTAALAVTPPASRSASARDAELPPILATAGDDLLRGSHVCGCHALRVRR